MEWNDVPAWVSAGAAIVSACGLLLTFWQVRLVKRLATTQFEDTLGREYRELAARLPTKALLGESLTDEEHAAALDEFIHYIDLCNEQVFLRRCKRITLDTWEYWRDGIQTNLEQPAFARAWIAFAGDDGADDLQPRHPGDVAEHFGQLEVHQFERLLHALDVLARQAHEVGALAHVVAQGLGGFVGLEDGRQQAVLVQPLDPLAVEAVGLGPPFDLPGEGRRGHHRREAGFEQGEEQHVAVDAGGFEGDGGDTALSQPLDEAAQARRVGGEFADGFAVGGTDALLR